MLATNDPATHNRYTITQISLLRWPAPPVKNRPGTGPAVDSYLLPTSKSRDTKTGTKIKKSGPDKLWVLLPNLRIRCYLPAS